MLKILCINITCPKKDCLRLITNYNKSFSEHIQESNLKEACEDSNFANYKESKNA